MRRLAAAKKSRVAKRAVRKPARSASGAKTKAKATARKKPKTSRKAFGGYAVSFSGRRETLEQVFGKTPIPPSAMTKKIWAFIKKHDLSTTK